jgi:hypothetical protein
MDVRLVAYRQTNSSTPFNVTEFELDLQESPNVVVNYNWLDLKNPDQRKASFSQTLKLPFSNRNNEFFENYFDVNLESLIYNVQTKFQAILYIDSIPQLKGFIQLKSIYINARLYEVSLFGNTADFFTDLKDKKLQDAFKNVNDSTGAITDDKQLDHKLTVDNVINSWTTGVTTTEDTPTTTNDIMYPIIDYGFSNQPLSSSMFWSPDDLLDEMGFTNENYNLDNLAVLNALDEYGVIRPSMLKPAIRIQRLIRIIAQKSGYQIKSTFFGIDDTNASTPVTDTNWFSRMFMTLAPQHERVQTRFKLSTDSNNGAFVGFKGTNTGTLSSAAINFYGGSLGDIAYPYLLLNNEEYDPNNMLFQTLSAMPIFVDQPVEFAPGIFFQNQDLTGQDTLLPSGQVEVETKFTIVIPNQSTSGSTIESIECFAQWRSYEGNSYALDTQSITLTPGTHELTFVSPIPTGTGFGCYLVVFFSNAESPDSLLTQTWTPIISNLSVQSLGNGQVGMFNGLEKGEVSMFYNMPDITQADFVKDLVNRFNLIIKTDPDNEKLLLIEPYQDYINAGTTLYWTDKLDVSKEQVIKSTNELQSKVLKFKDSEDNDFLNQRYTSQQNVVYGQRTKQMNNDFSNGDFENFSVMSPFIAQGIPQWGNTGINGAMPGQDVAIAYNFGAELNEGSKPLSDLKPKLFYYSGTPVEFTGTNPVTNNSYKFAIYSNAIISSVLTGLQFYKFSNPSTPTTNKFPLCTQYNLDNLNTGVVSNTKILNWTYYSPNFNTGFCFNYFGNTPSLKGYYNEYWSQYINEIYDKEARIMDCYMYLSPEDIRSFEGSGFQNTYFIKNTLWRILSVDNYLVGGNKSTKVKLIKVIEKLETSCDAIFTVLDSGLMSWTDSATGLSTTITNECCTQQNPDWVFVETNSTTGVGDCYFTQTNTDFTFGGVDFDDQLFGQTEQQPMLINNTNNNSYIPALMPNIENNFSINAMGRDTQMTRSITIYAQATSFDNSTQYEFTNNNYTRKMLLLPPLSMVDVRVTLLGTVLDGTNKGKVGTFIYLTLLVNRSSPPSFVGTAGGSLDHSTKDSAFSTPSVNITNFDSKGFWKPLIIGGADEQVMWTAKIELLTQPVGNDDTKISLSAIFQNGNRILFEDLTFLLWN